MWPNIVMLEDNFVVPLLVLWPLLLQCSVQTHQLRSILIPCNGFTQIQQLIILPHPQYSPDLAPRDYYLFADLKRMLQGNRFCSNEEVIAETKAYLEAKYFSSFLYSRLFIVCFKNHSCPVFSLRRLFF